MEVVARETPFPFIQGTDRFAESGPEQVRGADNGFHFGKACWCVPACV